MLKISAENNCGKITAEKRVAMEEKKRESLITEALNIIYYVLLAVLVGIILNCVFLVVKGNKKRMSFLNHEVVISVSVEEYYNALEIWDMFFGSMFAHTEATKEMEKALDIAKKTKKKALERAAIEKQLGSFYLDQGRFEEAYEVLNDAYVIFRDKLGDKDGNTVLTKCNLALCYIKTNKAEQGFAMLSDAYDEVNYIKYKLLVGRMIASCETEFGDFAAAKDWYEYLLNTYKNFYPGDKEVAMNLDIEYGQFYFALGEYERALDFFDEGISFWEEYEYYMDLPYTNIYLKKAETLSVLGRTEEAEKVAKKALEECSEFYGEENVQLAIIYDTLASIYGSGGEREKQLSSLNKGLELALSTVGENHSVTATIHSDIGDYYYERQNMEEALAKHKKALEIRKNILGVHHADTIKTELSLTEDYLKKAEYEAALQYAEDAMQIGGELFGRDSPKNIYAYNAASEVYALLGRKEEAKKYIEISLDIVNRHFKEETVFTAASYEAAGKVKLLLGEYEEAAELLDKALTSNQHFHKKKELGMIHLYKGDLAIRENDLETARKEFSSAESILRGFYSEEELMEGYLSERLKLL